MKADNYIYHICHKRDCPIAGDDYSHQSLAQEGFIHCSTASQVDGVIQRYFNDEKELVILEVDPEKVQAKVTYEKSTNNELFPHVYGKINASSIVNIKIIKSD